MMRPRFVVAIVAAVVLAPVFAAHSYLPNYAQSNGNPTPPSLKWGRNNLSYNLNTARGTVVGGRPIADAVAAAFDTWAAAPNTALSFSRAGDTQITRSATDNINLICVVCDDDSIGDSETLAITRYTYDLQGGTITDADTIFNRNIQYSTDGPGTANGSPVYDLQTIAVHEFGHFIGLSHSPVVRAVMFWAAPDMLRTLSDDDVAGASQLYPGNQTVPTGRLSGSVTLNGGSVFGAHVFADFVSGNGYGGNIRRSAIGAVTVSNGTWIIHNVPAGSYTIGVEPMNDPISADNVSIHDANQFNRAINTGFTTRQF